MGVGKTVIRATKLRATVILDSIGVKDSHLNIGKSIVRKQSFGFREALSKREGTLKAKAKMKLKKTDKKKMSFKAVQAKKTGLKIKVK